MIDDPALALQTAHFNRGYRAILPNLSDLIFDIVHEPWHWARMRHSVIDFEIGGEDLSKGGVKVDLLPGQRVVRLSIHFHYELVLGVGYVVDPHT